MKNFTCLLTSFSILAVSTAAIVETQAQILDQIREMNYPKWNVGNDITFSFSMKDQILSFKITNEGETTRSICSTLLDHDYIKSMVLHASFTNFNAPRRTLEEFRLLSDGVVGSSSEIFRVRQVNLLPKESVSVEINVIESMNQVTNRTLQQYLSTEGSQFKLHMTILMRDVGIKSDCSLRYIFPLMTTSIKDGKTKIMPTP